MLCNIFKPVKRLISAVLAAVLLFSLCSCGGSEDVAFVMAVGGDPMCLDPQIADSEEAKLIVANCYEGLVRLDSNYKIVPGAAKSWRVSPDGLTYTFTLRDGATWQLLNVFEDTFGDENFKDSFNAEVTAYDFRFALRRALDPVTDSVDAEKLTCIRNASKVLSGEAPPEALGVEVKDKLTLKITLERANPDFLRLLTLPSCMPCNEEFFKLTHAKYGLELKYTLCNGPFYVGRWVEDNSLILYRNEGYRGESKVNPAAVYLYVNSDEKSVISKLKQHSYDCAYISDETYFSLDSQLQSYCLSASNTVSGLCFNCSDSVLSNVNLRRAIVMMTKTENITKPERAAGAASGIIADCCRFGSESYRRTAGKTSVLGYNEAEAVKLWAKGLEELKQESAAVTVSCTEEYSTQLQKAIQNWQRILGTDIVAKVEILSEDELHSKIKSDSYQIALSSVTAGSSSCTDSLKYFTSDSYYNIFNYSDEKYDALFDSILNSAAGEEIILSCAAAEKMITDNAVFCPLFTYADYIAVGDDVTGLYTSPAFEALYFMNGDRN